MNAWILAAWAICWGGMAYNAHKAYEHLSAYGCENRLRLYFWSKMFAGRKYFTDTGWSYRNRSWLFFIAWGVVCLFAVFLA